MPGKAWLVLLIIASTAFAGCASTASKLAQAGVDAAGCVDASAAQSAGDSFQYAGAVACKTATERYDWDNPSPYAFGQWSGAVMKGSLKVTVFDAAAREVHSFSIDGTSAEGDQGRTRPGFPSVGAFAQWSVEIEFTDFTGAMGLQLISDAPPANVAPMLRLVAS